MNRQNGRGSQTASRSNRSISSIGLGAHEYLAGFNSVGQVKASGVPDAGRPREKGRQLCDIRRDPARLVIGEQLGRRSPAGFVLEINVGERLSVVVANHESGGSILNGPRGREAAGGELVRLY
jgi:hypothetical protein